MNWLTPLTGLILAAALIPPLIVLYFLKLRRKPQAISSTFLWQKSVEDLRANAPFQKLRRSLLLFLQLLALALLALSVMQPQLQGGRQSGGKTVMLIDNSASMTSTNIADGGGGEDGTRLDEAKRRARERIETLYSGGLFAGSGGETMIVVFSDRAEVYSRFTGSKQQLLAAIDRIQPTHGETRIADALKLARAYTTNPNPDDMSRPIADPATLELYSDGRIADLKDQVLRGERLNYYAIGVKEADNVAFAGLSVERPYDRPSAVEVFASLLNFNQAEAICRIQLSVDGVARGIEETPVTAATVDPVSGGLLPGRANVVFSPFEQPRGAIIEVANLREDDLAADNIVQVVVPPPSRLKVALVSANPARSVVLTALEGMKFELLEVLSPARYEQLAQEAGAAAGTAAGATGGTIDRYDVIVFDGYQPIALPTAGGRYLSFGPTPPIEGLNDFGEGEQQVILSARDSHPALRYVTYDNLFISKFRLLQPAEEVQVLMEGSRGPAIVAVSRGALQAIHVTFDPLESNWPFQRGFVTFIFNAVDYLGHAGEAITTEGLAPGEAITARLPTGASEIKLQMPDSAEPEPQQPLDPTQFAWGPISVSGPYTLTWKAPGVDELQSRQFAVNLLSETEGRLDVPAEMEVGQETIDSRDPGDASYTPLWPWAIGICLAALMLEWWVYHRKAYI